MSYTTRAAARAPAEGLLRAWRRLGFAGEPRQVSDDVLPGGAPTDPSAAARLFSIRLKLINGPRSPSTAERDERPPALRTVGVRPQETLRKKPNPNPQEVYRFLAKERDVSLG